MKKMTKLLIAAVLAGSFTLANADVVQVWKCQMNEGKTGAELDAASSAWMAAAKAHPGGEGIEAYHNFPIAAQAGDGAFLFVVIQSDFEAWGKATEAYPGSAVAAADEAWSEVATCSGSSLWASEQVE